MKKFKSAEICRAFFEEHKIYRYRNKKIDEMDDIEIGRSCHWFCEDNNLNDEWRDFVNSYCSEYRYCPYYNEYVDEEYCCSLQMIATGMIVDKLIIQDKTERSVLLSKCNRCGYQL